jgi:hypothetical protein
MRFSMKRTSLKPTRALKKTKEILIVFFSADRFVFLKPNFDFTVSIYQWLDLSLIIRRLTKLIT